MSLVNKLCKALAVTTIAAAIGCSGTDKKINYPLTALPLNITTGYFGAMATHESTHALTAKIAGARSVDVDIIPGKKFNYETGSKKFFFGYTKYKGDLTKNEELFFDLSGPLAMFTADKTIRELLKKGYVHQELQPTFQWYALFNKFFVYQESIMGIARRKSSDLGKHQIGVAEVLLGTQFAYDIYDFGFSDGTKFFDVLLGNDFYKPKKDDFSFRLEKIEDGFGLFVIKKF